jgi:hypothetical protein
MSTHPLARIHQPPDAPMASVTPPPAQLSVVELVNGVAKDMLTVNNKSGVGS